MSPRKRANSQKSAQSKTSKSLDPAPSTTTTVVTSTTTPTTPPKQTLPKNRFVSTSGTMPSTMVETQTPKRPIAVASNKQYQSVERLKEAVSEEIQGRDIGGGCEYGENIFADLEVNGSKVSNSNTASTTTSPTKAYFRVEDCRTWKTSNKKIPHIEPHSLNDPTRDSHLKTSPDFIIEGKGNPCFPGSDYPDKPKWRFCATLIDAKTEKLANQKQNETQLAVYARECVSQHNRRFVFCMHVTEARFQLYRFDRSGYIRSHRFDIHEEADLFVRIILGVSCGGKQIGFDESVSWRGTTRYLRTVAPPAPNSGSTVGDTEQEYIEYEIINTWPAFQRCSICGRGTLCWLDKLGERGYLIKEAWRYIEREPETKWLQIARNRQCRVVVRMIAYEEGLLVSELRKMAHQGDEFRDRMWSKITLEVYGRNVSHFRNLKQLIGAFRDAISGHQELWAAEILHRDISVNNILLGPEDAEPGFRGIVIDLDLAISTTRQDSLAAVDFRTGTRTFQGLHFLRGPNIGPPKFVEEEVNLDDDDDTPEPFSDDSNAGENLSTTYIRPAHCHLDDLESFYYALVYVCCSHTAPGTKKDLPVIVADWENLDRRTAFLDKHYYLSILPNDLRTHLHLSAFFRPIYPLIRSLHSIIRRLCSKTRHEVQPGMPVVELYPEAASHYSEVLDAFDKALLQIERLPPSSTPTQATSAPTPTVATSTRPTPSGLRVSSTATSSRKRSLDLPEDGEKTDTEGKDLRPRLQKKARSASLAPRKDESTSTLTHARNKSA
ncbi:hypothetical protein AX16_004479 [Volvariella volvacea WC 439]|nr:hypothetical protein AX16_004479 [Volvariella volvacea WC 439]